MSGINENMKLEEFKNQIIINIVIISPTYYLLLCIDPDEMVHSVASKLCLQFAKP